MRWCTGYGDHGCHAGYEAGDAHGFRNTPAQAIQLARKDGQVHKTTLDAMSLRLRSEQGEGNRKCAIGILLPRETAPDDA